MSTIRSPRPDRLSLIEWLAFASEPERTAYLNSLTDEQAEEILWDWRCNARPNQILPGTEASESTRMDWRYWLVLAGRGFGKTRTGAETVREWVRDYPLVNLIGATADDARDIMVQGESGILAICPPRERPVYHPGTRSLHWPNGAKSLIFTADEPERLRGKQHMKLWCDELASWRYPDAWDQAMLGLRLGVNPQAVVTTTPRPVEAVRQLIADPHTVITRGSTYDNRAHLAKAFFDAIIKRYEGTRLGRQEIEAELLEDIPGALWTRQLIEDSRIKWDAIKWDRIVRIVVAHDPAVTSREDSDEHGIIVVALLQSRHALVLEDGSGRMTVGAAAHKVVTLYRKWKADCVVAETNQGGDLVEAALRNVDVNVAYKGVHAKRGKHLRAEPVSMLYEQGRIHHAGPFPELEDQLVTWTPQGDEPSPDRLDALVYGITELLVDNSVIQIGTQFTRPVEVW
jgi:phage terminase large subunit-like protein